MCDHERLRSMRLPETMAPLRRRTFTVLCRTFTGAWLQGPFPGCSRWGRTSMWEGQCLPTMGTKSWGFMAPS